MKLLATAIVAIAALSSAISVMEVVISYVVDERRVDRRIAALAVGVVLLVLGIPTADGRVQLDLFGPFVDRILHPSTDRVPLALVDRILHPFADRIPLAFGGLLLSILLGWVIADLAARGIERGIGKIASPGGAWIWAIRIPVILTLLVSLWLAAAGSVDGLGTDVVDFLGYL